MLKRPALGANGHFLIKLLLQELGQNEKRNWFGLRSWDRTSPNSNFLIKLQELGQNEKKQGGKAPRQTEAKKLGSSGASCEAENTRGLGLYNIQTFDVCILSNRAWRHSLATPLRAGVSKLRVKLRLRGLAASLGVARLTCVRRRVGGRV